MRDGDTIADTRRELPLPFEDRLKDIVRGSVASHEEVDQFPEHTFLALGP